MPQTAKKHFDADMARVRALADHARKQQRKELREDIWRCAWALAVGALDAYLCDAYVDLLCAHLRAYATGTLSSLPREYREVSVPAGEVLKAGRYASRGNWALRMTARKLMEEENMLQLGRVVSMFDPGLQANSKLRSEDAIAALVAVAPRGLVGCTRSQYRKAINRARTCDDKDKVRKQVWNRTIRVLGRRVKRRHDVVHNCDRPKETCLNITQSGIDKTITYVSTFVHFLDDHIDKYRAC